MTEELGLLKNKERERVKSFIHFIQRERERETERVREKKREKLA